jgi:hypothetical protein
MDNVTLNILIGILAAIAGGLLWKTAGAGSIAKAEKKSGKTREAVKDEIKKTPAANLVDVAPDADELRAAAGGIKERGKQRLWDRIRKIISGPDDSGNTGGGGG